MLQFFQLFTFILFGLQTVFMFHAYLDYKDELEAQLPPLPFAIPPAFYFCIAAANVFIFFVLASALAAGMCFILSLVGK